MNFIIFYILPRVREKVIDKVLDKIWDKGDVVLKNLWSSVCASIKNWRAKMEKRNEDEWVCWIEMGTRYELPKHTMPLTWVTTAERGPKAVDRALRHFMEQSKTTA